MSGRPIQPGVNTGPAGEEPAAGPSPAEFRDALAYWASGVTVLTATDGEEVEALTVSAFTSVSVRPPLVLVCVGNDAGILPMILEEGRFTVNLLAEGDHLAAVTVAQKLPLAAGRVGPDAVLLGALVSLVCRVTEAHPGGDHRIVVGEVERVERGDEAAPLLYYRREYRALGGRPGRAGG